MADIVDPETRSRMMAGITGKDTKPELKLRKALHALGYRYRLHQRIEGARPDIVLPRFRAVIFVHGSFWHRHAGCRYATTPSSRPEFWQTKFEQTVERDARQKATLTAAGWRVAVVWECALRTHDGLNTSLLKLTNWMSGQDDFIEIGESGKSRAC